jgi:hypothetical protein
MQVSDAQREVRTVFLGGFPGQLVSGTLWLISAVLGTWGSHRNAIVFLVVAGVFIFPLAQLLLRAMRRPVSLSPGNPLGALALQIALTIPLSLPLVGAATLHREGWFYPALMVVVGAHYLPFVFLYGMPMFAALGALMIGAGVAFGMTGAGSFSLGGWTTGLLLLTFAFIGRSIASRDSAR